ncbi:MAG: transcriptional repressor LexA [Planctomycetota bacterium]|nr:MAG: transcriptional repressor LexA [Planctomycetota bacterium]
MASTHPLTKRQQEVYNFIRDKIHSRGYGPTVREIADHFGIRSPNGVMCHLRALERKQLIVREPNRSRAIRLAQESAVPSSSKHRSRPSLPLPLVGEVAAGTLHEAIEQSEEIDLADLFDNSDGELFMLQVHGESMIEAQIADGDYVVVRRQPTADRGQIVVALTEDNEATLKRWFPEKNRIRLEPANRSMKPIYVKSAQVVGVVVGVIRAIRQ